MCLWVTHAHAGPALPAPSAPSFSQVAGGSPGTGAGWRAPRSPGQQGHEKIKCMSLNFRREKHRLIPPPLVYLSKAITKHFHFQTSKPIKSLMGLGFCRETDSSHVLFPQVLSVRPIGQVGVSSGLGPPQPRLFARPHLCFRKRRNKVLSVSSQRFGPDMSSICSWYKRSGHFILTG